MLFFFDVEVKLKVFYYRGLQERNNENGYLTDACLNVWDKYKDYLDYFRIEYKSKSAERKVHRTREESL